MTDKVQLIKEEIERRINEYKSWVGYKTDSNYLELKELLQFIDSLPEEPKFKVGDMVISTKNPLLTYKVLQVGLPNELGELDYQVEIFCNGKPGIKVGNTFKEHNIHLISCKKMDEWGKLIPESHNEDFEEAAKHYLYGAILYDDVYVGNHTEEDCIRCFKAGTEWQRKKDQETIELAEDHAMLAGMMKEREEMMKDAVDATIFSELKGSDGSLFQAKSDRFRMNGVKISDRIKVIPIKIE